MLKIIFLDTKEFLVPFSFDDINNILTKVEEIENALGKKILYYEIINNKEVKI